MISHLQIQRACRARLLTLSVATTGTAQLSATATGYARSSGSFLADGFAVGMELVASGFSTSGNNGTKYVTGVTASALAVQGGATVETVGTRTLAVGLPSSRVWENFGAFTPTAGVPYITERYLAGPTSLVTFATTGELEATPQYQVVVFAPSGKGSDALAGYADALLHHFKVGTALTLANGDTAMVRGDTGPFRAQIALDTPGWAAVSVTFPLRLYTFNT